MKEKNKQLPGGWGGGGVSAQSLDVQRDLEAVSREEGGAGRQVAWFPLPSPR